MQLYPHWLDGEFVKIATGAAGPDQDVRDMIRALKLHALLGTQFVLNDVQIFDSAAVLAFFGNPKARDFLRSDRESAKQGILPSFLGLKVDPDPRLPRTPFALAARGLTRTVVPGWNSSVFIADPTPIKHLANEIINDIQVGCDIDPARRSRTVQDYPQHAKLLDAARYAVHHFGAFDSPQQLVAPPGERSNYYKVLRKMAVSEELSGHGAVVEALKFIDAEIEDPDARKARSRVRAILHHERDPRKQARIWNNVVQAWNYATQQTLNPEGGSVGELPGAVSPAEHFDVLTDRLVPVRPGDLHEPMDAVPNPATLRCEVDEVSWGDVTKVREQTVETMGKLTSARYTQDIGAIIPALREHLGAVGKILRPPRQISPAAYVLKVGGFVVAAISHDPLKIALAGGELVRTAWSDTEALRQRRGLTDTLFRAVVGQQR